MKTLPRLVAALLVGASSLLAPLQVPAQETASTRKVVDRYDPPYPLLARRMLLEGVVKVDVVVAPNGSVKSVDIRGGHPVLVQAATNAVRQWRWEAAAHESHELVQFTFAPPHQ